MKQSPSSAHGDTGVAAKVAFGAFLAIAAFLLVAEHRAHVLPYLPWLLLAACPLLHLFMHRHHGHDKRQSGPYGVDETRPDDRRMPEGGP